MVEENEKPGGNSTQPGNPARLPMHALTRNMFKYGREATFELQIRHQASVAGTFQVSGGTRSALISTEITIAADADPVTTTIRVDDFPTFLAASSTDTANVQGALFVTVNLLINGEIVACLMSGNVTESRPLTWPAHNLHEQMPNRGEISTVTTANPAAGAQVSFTTDDNEIWRILWCTITLVTDANAATRRLHINFINGGNNKISHFSSSDHIANTTLVYTVGAMSGSLAGGQEDDRHFPILDHLWLEPSSEITTDIANGQVGDDLTALTIMREKFFVGN